ncbi:hypothetical protein ACJJTC_003124 [Scirpophaga incertulas]
MKDAACLDPKNFNRIKENGIPNDALKSIASIANIDRELLSNELESFANNFKELSKTLWDEHIYSRQHKQDSDSQSDEENDEDVLDLDQYVHHLILLIAYCVILTMSFTQVTCERRFSALKRIKTRLGSLLGQELLDSLIILNTESDLIKDDENSSFYDRVSLTA